MSEIPKGLRLVITIVDRKKGKKVIQIFERLGCKTHQTLLGTGTAPTEIFEYLGFGVIEKDVVLSVADEMIVPFMLEALNTELDFASPGHGVACSIPIQSVGGRRALDAIMGRYIDERKK